VHTDRWAIGRQLKLGIRFAPLVCPAVHNLNVNVFEVGRVAQHLETRRQGAAFLIVSLDSLPSDHYERTEVV